MDNNPADDPWSWSHVDNAGTLEAAAGLDDMNALWTYDQDLLTLGTGVQVDDHVNTNDIFDPSSTSIEELRQHSTCFGSVRCYAPLVPCSREFKALKPLKIRDVHICLLSEHTVTPETLSMRQLPVIAKESWYSERSWCGLQWSGEFFAVFSKKASLVFQDLLNKFHVQLDALVSFQEVYDKTKSLQRSQVATMAVEVNVYGSGDDTLLIGKYLSSAGLYLQQPLLQRDGVRYCNPHFLSLDGTGETPLFDISDNRVAQQLRLKASHSAGETEDDSGEDIQTILNSLSRGTMLDKRGGDHGIHTTLKEYVTMRRCIR